MNPVPPHVLVFDSGVGGLSIVQHLREILPGIAITYLADNQCFPYGMMEEEALLERVVYLLVEAAERFQPEAIIVACNSASTLVLPTLRAKLTIPIVGVVPAIKPAAQISRTHVIGLLATPGTIRRDYTDTLINEFAPDSTVIRVGSSQLVQLAEDCLGGKDHSQSAFAEALLPFKQHPDWQRLDTVVLACTHFPLIQAQLAAVAPQVVHWVDSGNAIARRVLQVLNEPGAPSRTQPASRPLEQALLTRLDQNDSAYSRAFSRFGFCSVEYFDSANHAAKQH